ncbi:hypothetical protein AAFC00_000407 [Neodothiora populina]|uniref:Rad60/SUMO-like domain-containing protein n=1 Tax=Neodothiora populina TaxID=2781224 RepID=A0ABR3PCU0_9PEZI
MADAPPKRSLFKRPAWAQAATTTTPAVATDNAADSPDTPEKSDLSLFSRSDTYDRILAEKERKRREKVGRKKTEQKKSHVVHTLDEDSDGIGAGKRRRISDLDSEDAENETYTSPPRRDKDDEHAPEGATLPAQGNSPTSHAPSTAGTATAAPQPEPRRTRSNSQPTIIELGDPEDDEDDDQDTSTPQPTLTAAAAQVPDSDSESDPELAELKRKARAKRRKEQEAHERLQSNAQSYSFFPNDLTPPPDPKVQLLITSPIPGATPLVVTRKLSQRLQEVREAWLSRQHAISPAIPHRDIFFTYRLRRLYDVTTCRSLNLRVDSDGHLIPDERDFMDNDETGVGREQEGKVHLEALTEELWLKMKDEKRRARNRGSVPRPAGSDSLLEAGATSSLGTQALPGDPSSQTPASTTTKDAVIRITMKAKGLKHVKLKIKPTTTFAKMANAARHKFGEQIPIAPEQSVVLAFDGDTLEPPEGLVQDTEIEDMDSIEVYFR